MELPKFVLADNTDYPDNIYVVHLDFPRFIVDIKSDENDETDEAVGVEFLESVDELEASELESEMDVLIEKAMIFYEREMTRLVEDEEDYED